MGRGEAGIHGREVSAQWELLLWGGLCPPGEGGGRAGASQGALGEGEGLWVVEEGGWCMVAVVQLLGVEEAGQSLEEEHREEVLVVEGCRGAG